jgi:hypothetical protein
MMKYRKVFKGNMNDEVQMSMPGENVNELADARARIDVLRSQIDANQKELDELEAKVMRMEKPPGTGDHMDSVLPTSTPEPIALSPLPENIPDPANRPWWEKTHIGPAPDMNPVSETPSAEVVSAPAEPIAEAQPEIKMDQRETMTMPPAPVESTEPTSQMAQTQEMTPVMPLVDSPRAAEPQPAVPEAAAPQLTPEPVAAEFVLEPEKADSGSLGQRFYGRIKAMRKG